MPRRKRRRSRDVPLPAGAVLPVLLVAIVVVAGGPVLLSALAFVFQWLAQVPPEYQTAVACLVLWLGTFAVAGVVMLLVALRNRRRQQKEWAWRQAMAAWQDARRGAEGEGANGRQVLQDFTTHQALSEFERGRPDRATALTLRSVRGLTPAGLEEFAAQVYERMGYDARLVGRSGDHGIDVRLVNPKGQVEIVQCKQLEKPVGEPELRNLFGALHHTKAVRAYLWAPGGFTAPARRWAKGKPLVLADEWEIERLVEAAYSTRDGVGRG